MKKNIKISVLTAAFLIGSMPIYAQTLRSEDTAAQSREIEFIDNEITEVISSPKNNAETEAIDSLESTALESQTEAIDSLSLKQEASESIVQTEAIDSLESQTQDILLTAQTEDILSQNVSPIMFEAQPVTKEQSSYSVSLPDNALIWASEDPNIGTVSLTVSALPFTSIEDGRLTEEIEFYIRTNYAAFMDKMELSIYRGIDTDLIEPLEVLNIEPSSFSAVSWRGELSDRYSYQAGDELIYVLRVYDKEGRFDETSPKKITLLKPEDAKTSKDSLKERVSKEQGVLLQNKDALTQYLLNESFSQNTLLKHNIVIYGSKIIIRGANLPEETYLLINNEQYPIDFERKFTAEYIVPAGTHNYDITLTGKHHLQNRLSVDVSSYYLFGTAIADFTLRGDKIDNSAYDDEDIFKEGRLAFYLKGKLYNKYHITAQADTTQRDLNKLFSGFTQARPTDLFESLDPDMYYPTYGDDSTTFKDVNTQGRFYIKAQWDKSEALWGNYDTGFNDTMYGSYSRSLYGAKLDYSSTDVTSYGESQRGMKLFGSQAISALGHSEFLGTGGSLYYLKHMDILPGSDKLLLQVTDKITGNTIARIELKSGVDYEIDNIQGRIILIRPLSQIIYQNVNTITIHSPQSGYEQRLIADYEYVPRGFEGESQTGGVRVKQWLGDNVAVGGTYVREEKGNGGDDYQIMGADITLQAGKGTYIKGEYTRTESNPSSLFYSSNGGLSFSEFKSGNSSVGGNALSVDARANFKEIGLTNNEFTVGGWYRDTDREFASSASSLSNGGITEYGAESVSEITSKVSLYAKASTSEKKSDESIYTEGALKVSYKADNRLTLSAEADYRLIEESGEKTHGAVGALRADYDITSNLETYLTGQFMINDNSGKYENNDAVIAGVRYLFDSSSVAGRYITGHRGDALNIDLSHELNKDHTIYGGYTWNSDGYTGDSIFDSQTNTGFTVGQKWNLTNHINLYNESQLVRNGNDKGTSNSLGMDFYLGEGWNLGFIYQKGDLEAIDGDVTRDAFSVSVGQTSSIMNWLSKMEYRKDSGAEDREQFLTTNRLSYKINGSLRLAGRFNYSKTTDRLNAADGAEFTETNAGFAYRPFDSGRLALFGKYTYLYDVTPSDRLDYEGLNNSDYDQKSQIVSFEGVYKYDAKLELAFKYAHRLGEAKYNGTDTWFDSRTSFYAGQLRYDVLYAWHALLEYRVLDVKDGGSKNGYLVGIDKDINENFRIGAGYNFTDFSDDLRVLDYKSRGWYLNVVGVY
jgi:hypothetical protein